MQIIHDHSFISRTGREFISHGYACESIYSLRFSFIYTEAQQAESRAYAESVGPESGAWSAYITDNARQRSQHMEHIAAIMAQASLYFSDSYSQKLHTPEWGIRRWQNSL